VPCHLGGRSQAGFHVLDLEVVRIAFQADSLPELQIQQAPYAVVMIAVVRPVFVEETLDCRPLEKTALQAARFEQKLFDHAEVGAGQPAAPGSREAEFRTIKDGMGEKVFHCSLENALAGQTVQLMVARDIGGELDQNVIEEGYTAFDRGRHTHVVLLHQQLDQVGFDVGIEQALEHVAGGTIPVFEHMRIGCTRSELCSGFSAEQAGLVVLAEGGEEVVEIERGPGVAVESEKGVPQFSAGAGADQTGQMNAARWQTTYDQLKGLGILAGPVDPDSAYSLKYVQ